MTKLAFGGHYARPGQDLSITRGLEPLEDAVTDFHDAFGCEIGNRAAPSLGNWELRLALLQEELDEYRLACLRGDLVGAVDGMADLMYVCMGTLVAMGVEAGPILEEVHRSNMTKLGLDGRPIHRGDGKVVKGPLYEPPDLAGALDAQRDYYSMSAEDWFDSALTQDEDWSK